MIIHLQKNLTLEQVKSLASAHKAIALTQEGTSTLVLSSKIKSVPIGLQKYTVDHYIFNDDIQLASKKYQSKKRSIEIRNSTIGGATNHTLMMAGPCSIESWEQITHVADQLKKLGISTLRAGSFKPRTSPYTFQGLGEEGLKMLSKIREIYGLNIITEVKDSSHVAMVIEYSDIIQIGTKAMYDQSILKACGKSNKPVLLKRGFGTTLQEFVQAAEFILSGGNSQVMLCERGIRTFENKTRFTLDLTGVAYLKEFTNLPVVVDPSHAMGYSYGVPDLTRAAIAMGVDGVLIETHPNPEKALSDAAQQLNLEEFESMYRTLQPIASAIGRKII